ncbi:MAG: AAA family ATPase [Candidatus Omnitrophica bacterium]|nr:AAA family ATPase [Candidatus Omnitrophota bacterium]MBU1922752.1 AAA family ATPase [Candidatus Omnitrophota bacterium]
MAKKIFIAATMQNDGKTTVSLGLIAALKKHFGRLRFIKPIGQKYLLEQGYTVDEDSVLIEEVFGVKCSECTIKDMSPITIEKGFTERYIENGPAQDYAKLIKNSYETLARNADLVIIEGTGHAGVGSVIDLSNASVASLLGADVILISSGGIGKPIDEIMLNKALFDREGVNLAGVIVNKVLPERYDKVARLVRMGLEKKGLNVLGVLPYQKILDMPTMCEIREWLNIDRFLTGDDLDLQIEHVLVGAMEVHAALKFIENNTMMIIPGDRIDMIQAVCQIHMGKLAKNCRISGIVLSGGIMPEADILNLLADSGIPTLLAKEDTYSVALRVNSLIPKLKSQDIHKIKLIIDIVEKYVDIDKVLASLK